MKAILIDVDFNTGERPKVVFGVDGKIKKDLWCGNKWQNLETGKEIRIIKSGNSDTYEDQAGIKILKDEAEIQEALLEHCPEKEVYSISNESIMSASIVASEINFEELAQEATQEEELAFLYDKGVRGIDRKNVKPQDPSEIKI